MNNFFISVFKKRILLITALMAGVSTSSIYGQYCTPYYEPVAPWVGYDACGASVTFPGGHLITNVTIGTINNTVTTSNCTEYDFTSQSTVVYDDGTCQPTPMTVSVTGWCGVTVAVDLNNDFDFDDPGEIVIPNTYIASSPAVYNLDLPIPPGTPPGPYRMRVYNAGANSGNETGGACDVFAFGNFHDYTIIVANNPNPLVYQYTLDTTICYGQGFNYGGVTYYSSQTISENFLSVDGCDSLVTINLTVLPPGNYYEEQTICFGTSYNFGGQIYATSGIYSDTFQTSAGCDSIVQLSLTVLPPPEIQSFNEHICEGDSFLFAGMWLTTAGTYTDTLRSATGCDSVILQLELFVHSNPQPEANFQPADLKLCIGDPITLYVQGANSYEWFDAAGNFVSDKAQFNYLLHAESNTLYVTGKDQNNCLGYDTLTIAAEVCCHIILPSVFSPNGDGLNDEFKPIVTGNPKSYSIFIYNRWGQLVYKSHDTKTGWNGRTGSGKPADVGTYFWHMKTVCANDTIIQRNGDITLVR